MVELASLGFLTAVLPVELPSQLETVVRYVPFKSTRDSRDNLTLIRENVQCFDSTSESTSQWLEMFFSLIQAISWH